MKRLLALLPALLATTCGSSAPPQNAVATITPAAPNTAAIDTLLRTAVEKKRVPHVVGMVATGHGVVYEHTEGVKPDAIYAIASMTKPVTSIAIMQLVEAGKIKLEEPAATYAPDIARAKVLDAGTMRPPKTPVTVRHLLTHTSGFGYEFMNKDLFELVGQRKLASVAAGGGAFLKAPLLFDPGTDWAYGISVDWLGRIVERVSGESLEAYFRQHIFDPLGMADSFFVVPADKQPRLAKRFQRQKDGSLVEPPPPPKPAGPITFFSGGGGLFSTAHDYMTLARAVMAGGELGQKRILNAETVTLMGQNQIGELAIRPFKSYMPDLAADNGALAGNLDKFGFGFAVNTKPSDAGRGANTMAWAGIYNTFFWIDREKQISAVLMTQMLPGLEAGPSTLLEDFDRAVYAAHFPR
jgi:CubicO group peptidase (beta-lactamase class C family)